MVCYMELEDLVVMELCSVSVKIKVVDKKA